GKAGAGEAAIACGDGSGAGRAPDAARDGPGRSVVEGRVPHRNAVAAGAAIGSEGAASSERRPAIAAGDGGIVGDCAVNAADAVAAGAAPSKRGGTISGGTAGAAGDGAVIDEGDARQPQAGAAVEAGATAPEGRSGVASDAS